MSLLKPLFIIFLKLKEIKILFKLKIFVFLLTLLSGNFAAAKKIDLFADDSLVWNREKKTVQLHNNATIKTDEYTITANDIIAFYKDKKDIFKIEATGNVNIKLDNSEMTANKILYDITNEIITFFAAKDKLIDFKNDKIKLTSNDKIIYYRNKNFATATKIELTYENRVLSGDKANINFENKSANKLKEVNLTGNIKIVDNFDELTGDKAHYNVKNDFATVSGNVSFKKGNDADLQGSLIEYNMKTGIIKILPNKDTGKVKGSFKTNNI